MNVHVTDNVISIATVKQAPPKRQVTPKSAGVINDCRDLAVRRICEVLGASFDKIEDELFQLASSTPDRETQNMYLDARTQAREKRSAIEGAFRKQFLNFFQRKVAGDSAREEAPSDTQLTLSLVANDALD